MVHQPEAAEIVLIVDDEEPVRKTFHEWLDGAQLGCQILTAADAEAALVQANRHTIDLAILDWNLGAGNDGLQLLEDLYLFNHDVVAIMITGFAHQATPLDAMRMGVRDYLDKNQDLDRDTFLAAVRRQLERIRPAKRERRLHRSLVAFREAVDKVLPLVQAAAALNDPAPLPEAIRSVFHFLLLTTRARDGVLIVRSYDPDRQPAEVYKVYDVNGAPLEVALVPFAHSLAASVVSLQEPHCMNHLGATATGESATGTFALQPFERGRQCLLAAPVQVAPGFQVVLELFDKRRQRLSPPSASPSDWPELVDAAGFTGEDLLLVGAAAEFVGDVMRRALSERQMHQLLLDAVAAALGASESVARSLRGTSAERQEQPPPPAVLDRLREGLNATPGTVVGAEQSVRLAEAIRVLALRHGPSAVDHCIRLVEDLRELLDTVTGPGPDLPASGGNRP
jgi:ActR/RegA family two-component response regulator